MLDINKLYDVLKNIEYGKSAIDINNGKCEDNIANKVAEELNDLNIGNFLREFPIANKVTQTIEYNNYETNDFYKRIDINQITKKKYFDRIDILYFKEFDFYKALDFNKSFIDYKNSKKYSLNNISPNCIIEIKQSFPYHNHKGLIKSELEGKTLAKGSWDYLGNWYIEYELREDLLKRFKIESLKEIPFIWILAIINKKPVKKANKTVYESFYDDNAKDITSWGKEKNTPSFKDAFDKELNSDDYKNDSEDYFKLLFEKYFNNYTVINSADNIINFHIGYAKKLGELFYNENLKEQSYNCNFIG